MEAIYRNPKLYFVSGKARSGKSTVAEMIKGIYEQKGLKAVVLSYARYHKDYVKSFFGWDGKEETKPRELLQQLGTEIIREKLNMPFFFVNRMSEDIKILSYFFDVLIISDTRFKKEIDMQRERFDNVIAVRVVRANYDNGLTESQKQHSTEIDLDDYNKFDYLIKNDGTIDGLRKQVIDIINREDVLNEENDKQ